MAATVLIKDRYEKRGVLGRGGMGVVYKAYDTLMRREVALKTLRGVAGKELVELFYRETSVLASMVHPNVVEIFDMGEFEEEGVVKPYFVMPLLPGRTLYDLIYPADQSANQPLAPGRCVDIFSQACRGLQAAHDCDLLHRDIKPRNIFVMRDDAVKVIDFGVVQLGNQAGARRVLGTLHYMSPEQVAMQPLTNRSDVFSLGTVCYEALTAVQPFMRFDEAETAAAVSGQNPALASVLNPLVNRALAHTVAQAMAKDPRDRFESAAAFGHALQRAVRSERPGQAPSNTQNRLARAQRSFARGDYEFADEILGQVEAHGNNTEETDQLRRDVNAAIRARQEKVSGETAQRFAQEQQEHEQQQEQQRQAAELATKALDLEERGSLDAALEEWLCVGDICPKYPGLAEQIARVKALWQNQRSNAKAELVSRVTAALDSSDHERAGDLLAAAGAEFADDPDFQSLVQCQQALAERFVEIDSLLARMHTAQLEQRFADIPVLCQVAAALSRDVEPLREKTFNGMAGEASNVMPQDWRVGETMLHELGTIGVVPPELWEALRRAVGEEEIQKALAARPPDCGDPVGDRQYFADMLQQHPGDSRLEYRLKLIDDALNEKRHQAECQVCVGQLAALEQELAEVEDHRLLWDLLVQAKTLAQPFLSDALVGERLSAIGGQLDVFERAAEALSRDNVKECYELCEIVLARIPGHRVFQQLKDQATQRRRELSEEYFARVERWLASEPNPANREEILLKALQEYPDDARYEDELRNVREEKVQFGRDLATQEQERTARVERLVAESREHLNQGRFADGYQGVREAMDLLGDRLDVLRPVASDLVSGAKEALRTDSRLAEAMITAAQQIDPALRLPNDTRAKIAEARKRESLAECLAAVEAHREAGDLRAAIEVANDFLNRFPGVKQVELLRNQLLSGIDSLNRQQEERVAALKIKAERAQLAAKYLTEVKEMLAGESDLTKQERILEDAVHAYPDESYFAEALEPIRKKREELDARIAGIREMETKQLYGEAMREWRLVRESYPWYPGVEDELERLSNVRRQAKQDAMKKWIRRVEETIESGDYDSAGIMIRQALQQLPADQVQDLEQKLRDAQQRGKSVAAAELPKRNYPPAVTSKPEQPKPAVAAQASKPQVSMVTARVRIVPPEEKRLLRKKIPAGSIVLATGLVSLFAAVVFVASHGVQPLNVPLDIRVVPERVTVMVDKQTCVTPACKLTLKPGEYTVLLDKKGYQPQSVFVVIKPGKPVRLNASLEPQIPTMVQAVSDTGDAGAQSKLKGKPSK